MCVKVKVEDSCAYEENDVDEISSMMDVCVCFGIRWGCDPS